MSPMEAERERERSTEREWAETRLGKGKAQSSQVRGEGPSSMLGNGTDDAALALEEAMDRDETTEVFECESGRAD